MKRFLYLLILLVAANISIAQAPALSDVRAGYRAAAGNQQACENLIDQLDSLEVDEFTVHNGYLAAATMMMAKYSFSPIRKFNYFEKGKKLLEQAIQKDPEEVELRYLRFAVQSNLPGFLGYKKQMKYDRAFLESSVPNLTDEELKQMIKEILIKLK